MEIRKRLKRSTCWMHRDCEGRKKYFWTVNHGGQICEPNASSVVFESIKVARAYFLGNSK